MDSLFVKKNVGAAILAVGSIMVFISSFLNFYICKVDGEKVKANLKELSDMADEAGLSTFNPKILFIIYACIGIIAACGMLFAVGYEKISSAVGGVIGLAALITIIVYSTDGALGDIKDYIDSLSKLASLFGEGTMDSDYGPALYLNCIGSIFMLIGPIFYFVVDHFFPSSKTDPSSF